MVNGIYTATGGMMPRIVQIDNVANNLANVSTHGYKKSSIFLRQLITAQKALDHAMGIEGTDKPEDVWKDFSQGTFDKTENLFDIALNGPGFFRVRGSDGSMHYTRDGQFHLDHNGVIVNSDGMSLLDNTYNLILVDGDEINIMANGDVYTDGELTTTIGLADFAPGDYQALSDIGHGLFEKPQAVNETFTNPETRFYQGYLEDANVEPVRAMVDMIEIFRAYELGQKAVQIQDQTLQRVVTELGTVR